MKGERGQGRFPPRRGSRAIGIKEHRFVFRARLQPDTNDCEPVSEKYDAYPFFGGWRSISGANSDLPQMSADDNYEGPKLWQDAMYFGVSF